MLRAGSRIRRGFTLIELLVVISIIGTLIALLLPAVQRAKQAGARASCLNNMKQIVLAAHNYESANRLLPNSKRTNQPQRSWAPDLLPFLEQSNMVSSVNYNLEQNWWRATTYATDPVNPNMAIPNSTTVQKHLAVMLCPSTPIQERLQNKTETAAGETNKIGACGDYFTPEGVDIAINAELPASQQFVTGMSLVGMMRPYPERVTINSATDGASNTIFLGECAGREDVWRDRVMTPAQTDKSLPNCARARGGAWATNDNPYSIGGRVDWCVSTASIPGTMKINNSNEWGHLYYSFHDGGAQFAFGDGSVRFISDKIGLAVLAALTTRAGGEAISSSQY